MTLYRVVLPTEGADAAGTAVEETSPERAASRLLGIDLVRSGAKATLAAKVYFQHPGQSPSMVRLYGRARIAH